MITKTNPVAVFDSGVGGISVLKELVALLPNENFRYFGDSANAPYGTKTTEHTNSITSWQSTFCIASVKTSHIVFLCCCACQP